MLCRRLSQSMPCPALPHRLAGLGDGVLGKRQAGADHGHAQAGRMAFFSACFPASMNSTY